MWSEIYYSRYGDWVRAQEGMPRSRVDAAEGIRILVDCINQGEVTALDGSGSQTSLSILKYHGATEFEMNSNWILSPQGWTCPCCCRSKFQISRRGKHGQILAKSVVHHDHMGEVLRKAFNTEFVKAGTDIEQVDGLELIERMRKAFAAYDEVLVCEDCNNADTLAKKELRIPVDFSFSIGQIASFVETTPHQPHAVDLSRARVAWESARHAFELRMRIVAAVARAAATDNHWYEPNGKSDSRLPLMGGSWGALISSWLPADSLISALGHRAQVSQPNRSKWRTERKRPGVPLPPNYVALLLSDKDSARHWQSVPDDWGCFVCLRSKHDCVYVLDKGNITFRAPETRTRSAAWRSAPRICNHCSGTLMSVKWEVASHVEVADSYSFVTPKQLSEIIIARPNSHHSIRPQLAEALVKEIIDKLRAAISEPENRDE